MNIFWRGYLIRYFDIDTSKLPRHDHPYKTLNIYGLIGRWYGTSQEDDRVGSGANYRIKSALNAKSEKEALNAVLGQFDTQIQLAKATLRDAGTFEFEEI